MIVAVHTIVDFAAVVYFVKPYRVFFLESVDKIVKPLGFKVSPSMPIIVHHTTTTIPE